jgi:hypothetical protein
VIISAASDSFTAPQSATIHIIYTNDIDRTRRYKCNAGLHSLSFACVVLIVSVQSSSA